MLIGMPAWVGVLHPLTDAPNPKRNLGIATRGPESCRSVWLMHLPQSALVARMNCQSVKRYTIATAVRNS